MPDIDPLPVSPRKSYTSQQPLLSLWDIQGLWESLDSTPWEHAAGLPLEEVVEGVLVEGFRELAVEDGCEGKEQCDCDEDALHGHFDFLSFAPGHDEHRDAL